MKDVSWHGNKGNPLPALKLLGTFTYERKVIKMHKPFDFKYVLLTKPGHILQNTPKAAPSPLVDQMPLTQRGAALGPL